MEYLFKVTVVDANGGPIQSARVTLDFYSETTDLSGTARILAPSTARGSILSVSHPDYVDERVSFKGYVTDSEYDNPLLERVITSQSEVSLTIRLGRYMTCPTRLMSESEMKTLATQNANAGAVWLDQQDGVLTYRGSFFYYQQVELADQILTPEKEPSSDAAGWRRFNSKPAQPGLDPKWDGRFYWIQCPNNNFQQSSDRMAVLVWSPNVHRSEPPEQLDMILFYSPSTATYPPRYYPFGCVMFGNRGQPKQPDQSYMGLGQKYLEREFMYLYQLIGRKKTAAIIMPICRHGDWDQFLAGEGVFRLCREVCLFLHRECRTSNLSLSPVGGVDPMKARAGASLRSPGIGLQSRNFGKPPRPGRLAVSFFSFGAAPAKQMVRHWSLAKSLSSHTAIGLVSKGASSSISSRLWGCPEREAQDAFAATFQEWWDMDGFHANSGGWPECLNLLNTWMDNSNTRIIRMCHSAGRSPRHPETELKDEVKAGKPGLWSNLLGSKGERITVRRDKVPGIKELHGRNWAVVAIDDNRYISGTPPKGLDSVGPQTPWLLGMKGDDMNDIRTLDDVAHHATPKVAFSQFVALSSIGDTK